MPNKLAVLPPKDPMLTIKEVAARLSVSTRTVHRMIKDGLLPCLRPRRAVRIDPADLKAFIAKQKTFG